MYSLAKDIWSKSLRTSASSLPLMTFAHLQIADVDLETEEAILVDERDEMESGRTRVPFVGSCGIFYTCAWCPSLGLEYDSIHTQLFKRSAVHLLSLPLQLQRLFILLA